MTLRELIKSRGIQGKVIVSAEIGLNHNGSPGLAMKCIEAAADAGCQAVKFQNYRTGDVVKTRLQHFEIDGRIWKVWDLFSRCELDYAELAAVKDHAEKCGLLFHSTPTNEQGVRDLRELGVGIVKIASDMATNRDFLQYAKRQIGSLIVSTGCQELKAVVLDTWDTDNWVTLHCVRQYPTPAAAANLERLGSLYTRIASQLPQYAQGAGPLIGYSDHTEGIDCAVTAVRDYGACWIEKHFTMDKTLPGPDHRWSADPKEMATLTAQLKSL